MEKMMDPRQSLPKTPDATSGEDNPKKPLRLSSEAPNPTQETHNLSHNAPAGVDQDSLTNVQLQAVQVHAKVDNGDENTKVDLDLWHKHACRSYLIKLTTGQPSYEIMRIIENPEEHKAWIKDDLLRTRRALLTLEFDESKRIKVQQQRRMAKVGLRRRLLDRIFRKRVRKHDAPQGQQSHDDTGSVRSDGSDSSWDTANSNSSQTSDSAMNDAEQSCAQLLRIAEDFYQQQFDSNSRMHLDWRQNTNSLAATLRRLEASLKVHKDNASEIGFSNYA